MDCIVNANQSEEILRMSYFDCLFTKGAQRIYIAGVFLSSCGSGLLPPSHALLFVIYIPQRIGLSITIYIKLVGT